MKVTLLPWDKSETNLLLWQLQISAKEKRPERASVLLSPNPSMFLKLPTVSAILMLVSTEHQSGAPQVVWVCLQGVYVAGQQLSTCHLPQPVQQVVHVCRCLLKKVTSSCVEAAAGSRLQYVAWPPKQDYCTRGKPTRGCTQVDGEKPVVHVTRCFRGCRAVAGVGSGVGLLLLLLLLQQAAVVTYASGTGSGTHPDTTNPSCCKANLAVFGARNMTFFSHKSILNSLRQIWRDYPVGKCLQQGSDAAGGDTQETEKAQPIQITHEYYPYFLPKILITFQANPSRFLHKSGWDFCRNTRWAVCGGTQEEEEDGTTSSIQLPPTPPVVSAQLAKQQHRAAFSEQFLDSRF